MITFKWLPNPFFTDEQLRKEFKFADDGTLTVMGQEINWKEDMVRTPLPPLRRVCCPWSRPLTIELAEPARTNCPSLSASEWSTGLECTERHRAGGAE